MIASGEAFAVNVSGITGKETSFQPATFQRKRKRHTIAQLRCLLMIENPCK